MRASSKVPSLGLLAQILFLQRPSQPLCRHIPVSVLPDATPSPSLLPPVRLTFGLSTASEPALLGCYPFFPLLRLVGFRFPILALFLPPRATGSLSAETSRAVLCSSSSSPLSLSTSSLLRTNQAAAGVASRNFGHPHLPASFNALRPDDPEGSTAREIRRRRGCGCRTNWAAPVFIQSPGRHDE